MRAGVVQTATVDVTEKYIQIQLRIDRENRERAAADLKRVAEAVKTE